MSGTLGPLPAPRSSLNAGGEPASGSIIDADYVVVEPKLRVELAGRPGGQLPPETDRLPPGRLDLPASSGMDMLRRVGEASSRPANGRAGPIFWTVGILVSASTFWVAGGHALVSDSMLSPGPQHDGLRIASVVSRVDRSGVNPVLFVDGKAVNDSETSVSLPPLQIHVVSTEGSSTLYKLGTAGQSLDGGDSFDFSSRLNLPKDGVRTVFVTFAD